MLSLRKTMIYYNFGSEDKVAKEYLACNKLLSYFKTFTPKSLKELSL